MNDTTQTTPAAPDKHAEGWGWWCETCGKEVPNSEVTFWCKHDVCGDGVEEIEDAKAN